MSKHCRECGKLMQLRHATFARSGGYKCINRNCPESPIFRYQTLKGDLILGRVKAGRLKAHLDA